MALKLADMISGLKQNPAVDLPSDITIGGSTISALGTVTSAGANAIAVGPNGTTNPVFNIDASTGSQAAGINLTGATSGGSVTIGVTSSGATANLKLDGKGTGTVLINSVATTSGLVTIGNTTSLAGAAVNGVLTVNGTLTAGGLLTSAVQVAASGPLVYSGSGAPTISAAVKGSIYLRSDGTSTTSRVYVASDTAGTWTYLTSGA